MTASPAPTVPLFTAEAASFGLDLAPLLQGVVDSGRYILGPRVQAFEAAFAAYVGVAHGIGVANGTDALELALRALDIGPGRRVVTVANAGFYGSTAIRAVGATPVYVDVDEVSLTLSPAGLAEALAGQAVDAVIVTHLYGQLADVAAIADLCSVAGVPLIEDGAQAHGARRDGRAAGAWGRIGAFSFYPTKNLGALGDGGALVTQDAALADRLRSLRQYGWCAKYEVALAGGRNSRLDELQAAVLSAKLPLLDAANTQRRAVAARYHAALADLPLRLPPSTGEDFVAHLYVLRTPHRAALQAHLAAAGIACDVHYPVADHRQPLLAGSAAAPILPVSEAACTQVLTLPCFPGLRDQQIEQVIAAVRGFHEGGA
ncbi:MAG: DegT/DnrJ/EryC1/StrS family aminotransferase [Burkholderiales bacterium]|nr:DegT/DnrJ/EryC1/StrS family aminotransferase [Burkholderiales bacterium]